MGKAEFILTTRCARGISMEHGVTALRLTGRTSCQRVFLHAKAPRTLGSWERAEHWSFCPEVTGVCNTQSLVHNHHPPGTQERAGCTSETLLITVWLKSLTDFRVVKFRRRNCYLISPCTQNQKKIFYNPLGLWLPPAHGFGRTCGSPPCLCKALHREHFLSLHIHHMQLMHWNTLDTITVCIVSL